MPTLIEELEYAACGQGPDAEQTLYWRARGVIRDARELATGVQDTVGCLSPDEMRAVAARIIAATS